MLAFVRKHALTIGVALCTGVVALAGPAAAGRFLTKKSGLKLFYTKGQADAKYDVKGAPVGWGSIQGIPAGFADGTDDTGGGGPASDVACSGCVGASDVAPDVATQGELDAHKGSGDHDGRYFTESELQVSDATPPNTSSNVVHWNNLGGVPSGFVDGVDDTGGTASNLSCSECVDTADIAADAVTSDKILNGEVTAADLAFDPATQAELNALGTSDGNPPNSGSNSLHWNNLNGVPAGFADGVDAESTADSHFLAGFATIGSACTNLGSFSITLPPSTPAGVLLVTGRHTVNVDHTTGTTDRGFLVWSAASANCGLNDTFRSYFRVPSALPTVTGLPAYEQTLFTQSAFNVAAGGGTLTLFLNGLMLSGASANDDDGNDQVHLEFHTD